jgi:hypothetical protein
MFISFQYVIVFLLSSDQPFECSNENNYNKNGFLFYENKIWEAS